MNPQSPESSRPPVGPPLVPKGGPGASPAVPGGTGRSPALRLVEGDPAEDARDRLSRDTGADLSQQDWRLMQRIARGDEKAVEELYDRFESLVFKAARQILPTRAEAEDAVQEVFIRLWQTADRFDPQRAKLVTWVMLIARRHLIDRLRRNIANPNPAPLDADWAEGAGPARGDKPEQKPLDSERNERLRAKIATLPTLQRVVIERAYLQGFTLREVSEQLGAPLGTVKSALSRALAKLREDLGGEENLGSAPPSRSGLEPNERPSDNG